MKLKEVILSSLLIGLLVVQNYLLFNFPITLTYLIFYILANKTTNKSLINMSVFLFVLIKNILYIALPTTILFDIIGLLLFVNICTINKKRIVYILIPFIILIHILLLDLSFAILMDNIILGLITNIATGFVTYIYAPLSIVLILIIDGVDILTNDF